MCVCVCVRVCVCVCVGHFCSWLTVPSSMRLICMHVHKPVAITKNTKQPEECEKFSEN